MDEVFLDDEIDDDLSRPELPFPPAWVVPDVPAIARERMDRINRMTRSPAMAEAVKQVYANDVVAFIDDWAVTYDPRVSPPMIPFMLFPRQRELLEWIRDRDINRQDGIVEKSRDTGVTWLCVCYAVWMLLFSPGAKIAFGSRKEALVDRVGDPDSILEKARILLKALPPMLLPPEMRLDRDLGHCKLVNKANGAVITGEAGNQIGRGGRSSIYFIDEAAYLDRPDRVEASLSANSNCKIYVSTPNGPGNPFFRKRHSGRYPVFTFHWRDDPRKDVAWRDEMMRKLEPWVFAQEVEIDYHASLADVCIPGRWVQAAQQIRDHMHIPIGKRGTAGLDVGVSGGAECVYIPRFGSVVLKPINWNGVDTTTTALRALVLSKDKGVSVMNFDAVGCGAGVTAGLIEPPEHIDATGVTTFPINVGDRPSNSVWPDGKRSKEKFGNLKAELWWRMRDRFEKTHSTFLALTGEDKAIKYPAEQLIALPPGNYKLIVELSSVRAFTNQQGKIVIESKSQLRSRGVSSPDYADALALTFAPPARIAHVASFHA